MAKTASVQSHARAGVTRFSLTLRRHRPVFAVAATRHCHCGKPAALKCKNGSYPRRRRNLSLSGTTPVSADFAASDRDRRANDPRLFPGTTSYATPRVARRHRSATSTRNPPSRKTRPSACARRTRPDRALCLNKTVNICMPCVPRRMRTGLGCTGAATRLHGISSSRPRRRRDSSPRNIQLAAAAAPRLVPTE